MFVNIKEKWHCLAQHELRMPCTFARKHSTGVDAHPVEFIYYLINMHLNIILQHAWVYLVCPSMLLIFSRKFTTL